MRMITECEAAGFDEEGGGRGELIHYQCKHEHSGSTFLLFLTPDKITLWRFFTDCLCNT